MELYIVTCGQFSTTVEINIDQIEEKEEIYMEAASQALENYFKHKVSDPLNDFTTVANIKETDEDETFVLLTKYVLINIGRHELSGNFKI